MKVEVTYRRTSRLSMRITVSGDLHVSAPWGYPKKDIEKFVESHREWIESAVKKMAQKEKVRSDFFNQLPLTTKEQRTKAMKRMNDIIPPLVERYATAMCVSPSGISYNANISRWGSCNVKTHRIYFSAYLLLLPEWCVEHIVVHELAHLIVPNHRSNFYAVMDRYFPRWKEARKETRHISRMEHRD